MKIFSTLKSYVGPGREQPSQVRTEIKSGLTLTGRVMKVKANGLALFDFNGTKAWSQVAFPVKEGTLMDVLVLEDQPRLKLKPVDQTQIASSGPAKIAPFSGFPSEKVLQKLQLGLGKILDTEDRTLKKNPLPRRVAAGIEQLSSHFRHLNLGKSISQLSARLRSLIENSGMFFEKKIEKEVQTLQRAHTEISSRHLNQSPEIRDIIKNDLKPCLLILKHFIQENEPKIRNESVNRLLRLKPMINQMLKDMAFEQTKSAGQPHEQAINAKMVYTDPRKGNKGALEKTGKLLPTIERLIPRLRHFVNTEGPNASEGIRHSLLKVIETFEMASSKENTANPGGYETGLRLVLKEDMQGQLTKLAEFFKHEAASNNLLDAKELEDIRKSLSHVRAEIDILQGAGEDTKKTQRPEAEQVMAFTLPLREEDGKGRLKIFYSKRKKGGADEGFKMSLFLEMENTGPVRTDFFLLNKKLKVTFYLIDHRIENIILKQADAMKTALADHFSHVVLDVVVSERKVENFDIEHLLTENTSLVDLRV